MKQEKFENIGQWKHTQVDNTDWNKQALSWPVMPDGQINDNYDWPMEGYLLAYAPPTKCHGVSGGGEADKAVMGGVSDHSLTSLRLQVVKNGADDPTKAVPIVAPVKITFHCNRENVFKDFRVLDSICIFSNIPYFSHKAMQHRNIKLGRITR